MEIAQLLCSEEHIPSNKLAAKFIEIYQNKPDYAITSFIELLFHAGGWISFKCCNTRSLVEDFKLWKECNPVDLYPMIFDGGMNFQAVFSSFVTSVVQYDECMLLYQEDFMEKVIFAFNVLVSSNWDSFRLVALILGMRLLLALDKEYNSLRPESRKVSEETQRSCSVNHTSALMKKRAILSPPWQQIFLKIYSGPQLCAYYSLSRCYRYTLSAGHDARAGCPFHEVLMWSFTFPTVPIQEDEWLPTILQGMRDKSVNNKGVAVMALYQLFRNPMDCLHQRKVFNHVKSDLLYLLKSRSDLAELCLRILNCCIRYMDIELSNADLEVIIYYLYDNVQTMGVLAAEFVFWSQFVPIASDPVALIVQLVEMNRESFINSEDLLIDSLYHLVKTYLQWGDWIRVTRDAPVDDVADFMRMMLAYVRKATTGFTPRMRKWRVSQQTIDSTELAANSSCFTRIFPDYWFSLLELRRIHDNPKAVASLLKMIQYLDSSILASDDLVDDLAQVCLAFLVIAEDLDVIEESVHSLASLKALTHASGRVVAGLDEVINSAVRQGVLDFQTVKGDETAGRVIQKKMLSLSKFFEINDSSLWWFAFEKLRNSPQCKMEQACKMKTIATLISLLFQLLMRKVSAVAYEIHLERNTSVSNVLINCCLSRTAALQSLIKYFLDSQYDDNVRKIAFTTLMDLLEFTGPSVVAQRELWSLHISLGEEEVTSLLSYATGMMESRRNCLDLLLGNAMLSDCCSVINKTCDFISRGLLDIHCITPFLRCIGRCSTHDELVMEAVNKFASNFPNRWESLAVSIMNAYVSMLENAMPSFPTTDDTPHRYRFSHLYMSLLNLTQYLVGRNKFENKNILKFVSVRLHMHMIDVALRPEGPRTVMELLYAVRETLAADDVTLIMSYLQQYRPDTGADLTKYYNFLKQSVFKHESPVPSAARVIYPLT